MPEASKRKRDAPNHAVKVPFSARHLRPAIWERYDEEEEGRDNKLKTQIKKED